MQRAIRIETLGDLAAHGYGLNATCEKCRHRADLDMAALIARFGASFVYVGRQLDRTASKVGSRTSLICGIK
jgi:hypothetical protein